MHKMTVGVLALAGTMAAWAEATYRVDFATETGRVRPELHSSGFGPMLYGRGIRDDANEIDRMNMFATRTHDWALINDGQRVVDTHFIFPLMHLDPKDPKNYYFRATDDLLKLSRDRGLRIFYRLGTSIEHTGGGEHNHYNILVPEDFEKYAEVLAGIVRHYNCGWANGHKWDIRYWEIWNEPDGTTNCWGGGWDGKKYAEQFSRFFAVVLKRLKSEFPDIKVGGPAMCWFNQKYFEQILDACAKEGVNPDFISWHYYGCDPNAMSETADKARAFLDARGLATCETILNEWHYIRTWDGVHGYNSAPGASRLAHEGPSGHTGIDSAVFNVQALSKLQSSKLDQAYYYGCGPRGNWGYLDSNNLPNRIWHSLVMFGDFVRTSKRLVKTEVKDDKTVSLLAGLSEDGKTAQILVADFGGKRQSLKVDVKGLGDVKRLTAVALDDLRDNAPCPVPVLAGSENTDLWLNKSGGASAAFLVTIERRGTDAWVRLPRLGAWSCGYLSFGTHAEAGAPVTLDLAPFANMGFADEVAGDGKGGWNDNGFVGDAHEFPVGRGDFAGVPFEVVDPEKNGGKSIVVFACPRKKDGANRISLDVKPAQAAKVLNLLHASAWSNGNDPIGTIVFTDEDGQTARRTVRARDDVPDQWRWKGVKADPPPALEIPRNTAYGSVCAFVTAFSVPDGLGKIANVTIEGEGAEKNAPYWMLIGATLTETDIRTNVVRKAELCPKYGFKATLNRPEGRFAVGEKVESEIVVTDAAGAKATKGRLLVSVDNFTKNPKVVAPFIVDLAKTNPFKVPAFTSDKPDCLRVVCEGDGSSGYYNFVNPRSSWTFAVAFDPEKIRAATPKPADFERFWTEAIAKAEKEIPLDVQMMLRPEESKEKANFYHISFAGPDKRVYGYYSVPKDASPTNKYPVRVTVPGAGWGDWACCDRGDGGGGITLYLYVHPFQPDNKTWPSLYGTYDALTKESQKKFGHTGEIQLGGMAASREEAYFYATIVTDVRAIKWLWNQDIVDRTKFVYKGHSQGGGMGTILTGLCSQYFTKSSLSSPALCDLMGYRAGRGDGWPHYPTCYPASKLPELEKNMPYFDAVNFATLIRCPVRLGFGMCDSLTPATTTFAAYNVLPSADKGLFVNGLEGGHGCDGKPAGEFARWLEAR